MDDKGAADNFSLRVSVATYNRVLFPHPENGIVMLVLERKATVRKSQEVRVRAQPFGGGVRILNPVSLQKMLGEIRFDSRRSREEQDFRILILPSTWEAVKQYGLAHLGNTKDAELESTPDRELVEEFDEALHIRLTQDQYTYQPAGFVIEDHPVRTEAADAFGQPTVRLYRIFEVHLVDEALCRTVLHTSQQYSDQTLKVFALNDFSLGGPGRLNSVLALPLKTVTESYLILPPNKRYRKLMINNYELDESVLAVLGNVDVPEYQRL